jgi:chitinase
MDEANNPRIPCPPAWRRALRMGCILGILISAGRCSHKESTPVEPSSPQLSKVVMGYYPAWEKEALDHTQLRYEYLTHIVHAFTKPDAAGNLVVDADYPYPELVSEAHRHGVKVIMSVGGWENCAGFPGMVAQSATRAKFIGQVLNFLKTNDYDGIDLDWEFVSNPTEQRDFGFFVKELSEALRAQNPPLQLSLAAPADDYWARWINFEELAGYFDFIGFMTYDFHGPWSDHSGPNSPLYLCGGDTCGSLNDSFLYGLSRKIPKEKLLVGLAFYGRSFDCSAFYQPFKESGEYRYADVAGLLSTGWTRIWDDCSQVPIAQRSDQKVIVSYDDEQSIDAKCRYVLDKNAAGVIIWELTQDTVNGQPVLLKVVGESFAQKKQGERP